jgi:FMN phosphatase YigB (HAD superfamily)
METVLREFGIREYFRSIVDSALVGIRKPDPAIFALGVKRLGLQALQVAVEAIHSKETIVPGKKIGCSTIWLKGRSWREEPGGPEADFIILDLITLIELS